ncbi:MAG: hypothetical protein AAF390_01305 [Pseudomonadota bacterium]
MALRVLTGQAVETDELPLAELAARMRMPDGWATVPDLLIRLETRLRAALAATERRTGQVLIRRMLVLIGEGNESTSVSLGVAPVDTLISVEVDRGRGLTPLQGAELRSGRIHLPGPLSAGSDLRATVEAGYGTWADVPPDLADIVLLIAERGEGGDPGLDPVIAQALAPFLPRRLGRSA